MTDNLCECIPLTFQKDFRLLWSELFFNETILCCHGRNKFTPWVFFENTLWVYPFNLPKGFSPSLEWIFFNETILCCHGRNKFTPWVFFENTIHLTSIRRKAYRTNKRVLEAVGVVHCELIWWRKPENPRRTTTRHMLIPRFETVQQRWQASVSPVRCPICYITCFRNIIYTTLPSE